MTRPSSENPVKVVIPLVLFVLMMMPAIGLLIAALTMWLAQLLGSAIGACMVAGGGFLLVAMVIYLVWLRGAVRRMQERLETIYETSRVLKSGFDWIGGLFNKFWL